MSFENLYSFIEKQVKTFNKNIDNVQEFQVALGMIIDYWTSVHNAEPHNVLAELLMVSDAVNAQEGKAQAWT